MTTTYDNEAFDDAVAALIPAHVEAIRAKLAAGDADLCAEVFDGMSVLPSQQWEAMIPATARGEDAYQAAMTRVITDMAELLAIQEVEDGIEEGKQDFILPEHRGVREFYRPAL